MNLAVCSLTFQLTSQFMHGNHRVSVRYCCWCTVAVAISTCCSSVLNSSITEATSERSGKADNYLMLLFFKAAIHSALVISLLFQKYKWIIPLYNLVLLEYTVHHCSLEPYTRMVLMCQDTKFTQSDKPNYPFSPPGWRKSL